MKSQRDADRIIASLVRQLGGRAMVPYVDMIDDRRLYQMADAGQCALVFEVDMPPAPVDVEIVDVTDLAAPLAIEGAR